MTARALRLLLPLVALAALSGCARHVVLDPSMVPSHNDPDWTVQHEPARSDPPGPAPVPM
jgi:hypothetical protein